MGKAFARKLRGFDVEVIFHDLLTGIEDENAQQVSLSELQKRADVLSLHTPQTELTIGMINEGFIKLLKNHSGLLIQLEKSVITKDLVSAIKSGKILGAGLDV